MSLSLLEFTIFTLHLLVLLTALIVIQTLNPGKVIREYNEEQTLRTKELEDQAQEVPFDPTTETYTMTENPMLRHRTNTNILREAPPLSTEETPEQIRLEDVD